MSRINQVRANLMLVITMSGVMAQDKAAQKKSAKQQVREEPISFGANAIGVQAKDNQHQTCCKVLEA